MADPRERIVSPRVHRECDDVMRRRERVDACERRAACNGSVEQIDRPRGLLPIDPLQPTMDLDDGAEPGPAKRLQVMDVPIEPFVTGQFEPRFQQGALRECGVVDDKVEIRNGRSPGSG